MWLQPHEVSEERAMESWKQYALYAMRRVDLNALTEDCTLEKTVKTNAKKLFMEQLERRDTSETENGRWKKRRRHLGKKCRAG